MGAKTILPREVFEAPSINTMDSDNKASVTKCNKKGGLDAWLI
jgi:hypothetical protein